ncbi:MAG TPA: hypothetical protein DEH78_29920 [Solibacterales bacterium]|nr:hypothetical protein [Bryobacterales bacterium]
MQPVREEESVDTLSSLEERILRAVELVSQLRQQNHALQAKLDDALAAKAEALSAKAEAQAQAARLQQDMDSLRSERKQVRTRIEKLLGQMDLLSES